MDNLSAKDRELLACNSYKEFLTLELQYRKELNSNYSMRAFARALAISPSSLSTHLNTDSHFSLSALQKIAKKLNRPKPIADFFLHLAKAEINAPGDYRDLDYLAAREIRLKHMFTPVQAPHRMIDKWPLSTLALSLLLRIEGELRTDEALARRLQIEPESLKLMLDELETLGWIVRTPQGPRSLVRHMELGNQGTAYQIKNLNRRALELALTAIDLPYERRFYYNSYFTMHADRMPIVSEKLRNFALDTGLEEGPSQPGQDVFVVGTFLIPLTHR